MSADFQTRFTFKDSKTGEPVEVFLSIDTEALAAMLGRDALKNKSRTAKLGGGLIVAKIRKGG